MQGAIREGVLAWAPLNGPSCPWVRRSQNVATIVAAAFTARWNDVGEFSKGITLLAGLPGAHSWNLTVTSWVARAVYYFIIFPCVHRTWHSSLHGIGWFSDQSVMPDSFSAVWTVAHQAPLSKVFSRQEYWSGLPCPPPGDCPRPGTEPVSLASPAMAGGFFTTESPAREHTITHQLTRHIGVSCAVYFSLPTSCHL